MADPLPQAWCQVRKPCCRNIACGASKAANSKNTSTHSGTIIPETPDERFPLQKQQQLFNHKLFFFFFRQALLLVFARVISSNPAEAASLLRSWKVRNEKGEEVVALFYILALWVGHHEDFHGSLNIKVRLEIYLFRSGSKSYF